MFWLMRMGNLKADVLETEQERFNLEISETAILNLNTVHSYKESKFTCGVKCPVTTDIQCLYP